MPISHYEIETGASIETFASNAVSLSTTRFIHFNVYRSTETTTVTRTIGKIDNIFSYVGGLFSLMMMVLTFFFNSYG